MQPFLLFARASLTHCRTCYIIPALLAFNSIGDADESVVCAQPVDPHAFAIIHAYKQQATNIFHHSLSLSLSIFMGLAVAKYVLCIKCIYYWTVKYRIYNEIVCCVCVFVLVRVLGHPGICDRITHSTASDQSKSSDCNSNFIDIKVHSMFGEKCPKNDEVTN